MRLPVSILSGVAASVAAALPLAWIGSGLHPWNVWVALLLGLMVAVIAFAITPPSPSRRPVTFWGWFMVAVFTCASARAFFWLLYPDGDAWKILSPNNLGDLSLHLSLIRWMAATPHWWPTSPILVGDPLRYPPGSDLFNALLLHGGLPVERGLLWCGIGGAALTGYALWRWGGAVALAAFLFNGGFAGWVVVKSGLATDPDATCQWKNLFLTLFITQRGFLFALPAGLIMLSAWREELLKNHGVRSVPLQLQALLLAVTPLFSIHASLFLGVAMTGIFLLVPASRKRLAMLAACSWPFMAFFGWLVTSGAGGPSALGSLGWKLGWMTDGSVGFWFWNFGIALPLAVILCLLLTRRDADREARAFVWPAALVFVATLLIRFAPWPWDNMKLMLWSWIVIAPYLWTILIGSRPFVLRAMVALLLFGSGAVTLVAGLDGRHGYELIRKSALDEAAWCLRGVPAEAVIACAPEYNHPVLVLGHPVVCGYEGHLWSHGLDYEGRLAALNALMNGESGWQERARRLGVSLIYWSDLEAKRWPDSKLPWARETTPSLHRIE